MTDWNSMQLTAAVEAILFAAGEPVTARDLTETLEASEEQVRSSLDILRERYEAAGYGLQLVEIAGGFQLFTKEAYAGVVERFLAPRRSSLSFAALETLAIIAYRQPATRAEVESLRGVDCGATLTTLRGRGLIEAAGRLDAPGRPIIYETNEKFLQAFGLDSLDDLPEMDAFLDLDPSDLQIETSEIGR